MTPCLARIRTLLTSEVSVDQKVAAATVLLHYFASLDEIEAGQAIVALVSRYSDDPRVRPITRMWWRTWAAHLGVRTGSLERTLADLERAAAIADEHGLNFAAPFLQMCRAHTYLMFGEPAQAVSALRQIEPLLERMSLRDLGYHGYLQCQLALGGVGPLLSPGRARELLSPSLEYGAAHVNNLGQICHAVILARHGEHQSAQECARRAAALSPPGSVYASHDAQLIEAYLALLRGDEAPARVALAAGMKLGSAHGYMNSMRWQPDMMATLCAFALEQNIEVEHARRLIRTLNLKPESADIEHWPWPVRIYTLGRFGVLLDGAPLASTRKAPKKIITLLKALIALGGREVPEQQLADALWPDERGDGARASLATAVHRLRKLLGSAETMQLHEGRLSLDAKRVWVDVWAFERLSAGEPDSRRTARALALHQGCFLASDSEYCWSDRLRERLRTKFIRLLGDEAQRLEQAGEAPAAATLYARGIETDSLAEAFYQGLMRCYRQQERNAEALAVYRRLRQALSVTLGIAPAPASEALYRMMIGG
jgi:DNA-binding SARP family transcriptional activator